MSVYKDYFDGSLPDTDAEAFGLPFEATARKELTEYIHSMGGLAYRGFDFAVAAVQFMRGKKEPQIVHMGEHQIIRPTFLHERHDEPYWDVFRTVFSGVCATVAVDSYNGEIPDLSEITAKKRPTVLAVQADSMIIFAQTLSVAVERKPVLSFYNGTSPDDPIIVTLERLQSSPEAAPVIADSV